MPLVRDIEQTYERFGIYIDQLRITMTKYGVNGSGWRSYNKFLQALRNAEARREISEILKVVAAHDGGKVGVGVIGLVLAMAVGGVGIAAMGSAVGISAAFVTALGALAGSLLGNELDGSRWTQKILKKVGLQPDSALLSTDDSHKLEGQRLQMTDPVKGEVLAKPDKGEGSNAQASIRAMARVEKELCELRRLLESQEERAEAAFATFESNQKDLASSQTSMYSQLTVMLEQAKTQYSSILETHREWFSSLQEATISVHRDLQNSFGDTSSALNHLGRKLSLIWYMTWIIGTLAAMALFSAWFWGIGGHYRR